MSDDEEFTPRLGRQRQQGGKRARRYLGRVVGAAIRSAEKGSIRSPRFDGSRIGRGASMGRLLSSRDRFGGMRARRAVVKTRLVRIGTKGMPAARAHLRYIQRDGVTREGARANSIRPSATRRTARRSFSAAMATATSSASSSPPRMVRNIPTSSPTSAG
jgi:hypothetical protein